MLELARTENRITLVRENYEPALVLNQVAELFRSALTSKDLGVHIEVDPALPRVVSGDEGSVRQILVNLMHNAVKFTEKGGISLRVRTDASGGLERIIYSVEDSGRGISAEKVTSVFDAFEQGDVTTATADGTGLGLAICRELCAQMDGVIELRSKKSEGSAFIVSLPLFMPVTGVVPVESKTGIKSFPEGSVAVLYVEDDGVNR
ncbi:MAG TPA: ATP-binding protein, partial [Leptospiraceae bacterium]|nr:ATP-binding protein [Leptospiraceae bacterium]